MAEIIKPIILDETGKEIVDAIKNISITVEGKNGLPQGGLANQILSKKSNIDYDAEWVDNIGQVESVNGKTGQVTLTAQDVGATTEQWVNQQNYLKSIPSEYITETELNAKGYLTEHQDISNLATKAEVPTKTSQLINDSNFLTEHQDLTGYATETYVDNKVSGIDLSGYALKTEIPTVPTNVSAFNNDVGYLTEIPTEYVTETELNAKGYLTEHQSLANYSTTEEMNNAISNHHDSTKQDTLTAGSNITIENNVISATGGGSGGLSLDDYDNLVFNNVKTNLATQKTIAKNNLIFGIANTSSSGFKSGYSNGYDGATNSGNLIFGVINGTKSGNSIFALNESNIGGNLVHGYQHEGSIGCSGSGSHVFGYSNSTYSSNYGIISDGEGSLTFGWVRENSYIDTNSRGGFAGGCCYDGSVITLEGNGIFAFGQGLYVKGAYSHVIGTFPVSASTNTGNIYNKGTYAFVHGNGTSKTERANAYTLDWQGNGTFAGTVSSSTGADYAEYFEWKDGNTENEDRVGYIVTLDGDKIVKANSGDDILGICSGTAMVLGDSAEWNWSKRFLTDDFGRIIYEDIDVEHEAVLDEEGNVIEESYVEHIHKPKENPNYDSSKPYERRSDRPEWQIVGMMGKLYVRDNGTCEVNGYATVDNGIAVKSNVKTNMRVMERVTENIVRVLLK